MKISTNRSSPARSRASRRSAEVVVEPVAHVVSPEGGDERHQDDEAGIGHQTRDLGDATDVLHPVGIGEPEVVVEPVAHVVSVEQEGVDAVGVQLGFDPVGDGGLARSG
jgi:hypothetical protein